MDRLKDKVALITGSAQSQGEAEARRFAAEGATVIVSDIQDELGKAVTQDIGEQASWLHLDVRDEDDWAHAMDAILEQHGRLDVLVNNAGVGSPAPFKATTLDHYVAETSVDQIGVFLGVRAAAQPMIDAGGGSIINISSLSGAFGVSNQVPYVAAKWAVRGMTKAAALELAPYSVRVNAVLPGLVESQMTTSLPQDWYSNLIGAIPLKRAAQPEEIANLVLFLASDESAYITGADLYIDGGTSVGFDRPGEGFDLLTPPTEA